MGLLWTSPLFAEELSIRVAIDGSASMKGYFVNKGLPRFVNQLLNQNSSKVKVEANVKVKVKC